MAPERTGATVVVVGASRGIGLALARLLAGRGDRVIATCRSAPDELRALPVEFVEGVDVRSAASLGAVARHLGERAVDVLLVVAAVSERVDLSNLDVEIIQRLFDVNALGPVRVVAALVDHLRPGSKLVFVTSRMGSIGDNTSGGHYAYRMSKAALNMAARSFAIDLRARGVAVGLVHPGFVQTDMTGGRGEVTPEEAAAKIVERIDALTLETSGEFLHAKGYPLPW